MGVYDKDPMEVGLAGIFTLEDLLEQDYKLVLHCVCCGKHRAVETHHVIEKLGRAFPVHMIASRGQLPDMQRCHPKDFVLTVATS